MEQAERTTWYILARGTDEDEYDRITLAATRSLSEAFFTIGVGEWSKKCFTTIQMADSSSREVFFRCKLLELSEDAQDFRLYISPLCQTEGWAKPEETCSEIESGNGLFGHEGGLIGLSEGWFELDTYVEINEIHDEWLGDVVTSLVRKHEWDLLYLHSHPIDWAYHVLMDNLDKNTAESDEDYREAWGTHRRIYQSQDRMLGRIVEAAGAGTLFVLVSDHGAGKGGPTFNPYHPLVAAGLTIQEGESGSQADNVVTSDRIVPDTSRSQVLAQRMCHIYINLKGRDPEGTVEPSDYEEVQRQVIDALYRWTDPDTGKRPVSLALTKTDARVLGLHGDRVGDVVYALYPYSGNQHGQQLSASESVVGKLKSLLVLSGPGVKKGCRMQRTCWLTDIVPTLCYLNHWPVPAEAEGSVLYQALLDPDKGASVEYDSRPPAQTLQGEQDAKKLQPGEKRVKGLEKDSNYKGDSMKSTDKKQKANERLSKLGYELPF